MTEQEAFERIKDELPFESGVINEALSVVEQACEKQIPKKLKIQKCDEKTVYICECGKKQFVIYQEGLMFGNKNKYCEQCGQAIDWEGYRDEKTSN